MYLALVPFFITNVGEAWNDEINSPKRVNWRKIANIW